MTYIPATVKIGTYCEVRWMIRVDMDVVLKIEEACFEHPWSPKNFRDALGSLNVTGMVAVSGNKILGYVIYERQKSGLLILNVAVDPEWRRQNVGRQMIQKLIGKLSVQGRMAINAVCCETSLGTQLFLKAIGFKCVEILPGHYGDLGLDGYRFRYELNPTPPL